MSKVWTGLRAETPLVGPLSVVGKEGRERMDLSILDDFRDR